VSLSSPESGLLKNKEDIARPGGSCLRCQNSEAKAGEIAQAQPGYIERP
jgi:hypothetical protein